MPKKKKAKTEEKENVDDSPRPKKESSKPARKGLKTQALLSLDDFKPPPIKTARTKVTLTQKTSVPSASYSYATRTRTKAKPLARRLHRLRRLPSHPHPIPTRLARAPKQTPPHHDVVLPGYSLFPHTLHCRTNQAACILFSLAFHCIHVTITSNNCISQSFCSRRTLYAKQCPTCLHHP
ncbi:hypothetical protein C8F01DRAFT_1165537 [Mycena amicta]|nr:hypothetical protein C8F01DRAFT_1165537 [Mycena amicta]